MINEERRDEDCRNLQIQFANVSEITIQDFDITVNSDHSCPQSVHPFIRHWEGWKEREIRKDGVERTDEWFLKWLVHYLVDRFHKQRTNSRISCIRFSSLYNIVEGQYRQPRFEQVETSKGRVEGTRVRTFVFQEITHSSPPSQYQLGNILDNLGCSDEQADSSAW